MEALSDAEKFRLLEPVLRAFLRDLAFLDIEGKIVAQTGNLDQKLDVIEKLAKKCESIRKPIAEILDDAQ